MFHNRISPMDKCILFAKFRKSLDTLRACIMKPVIPFAKNVNVIAAESHQATSSARKLYEMCWSCLLIPLLLFPSFGLARDSLTLTGTSVLVLWDKSGMLIGADSMVSGENPTTRSMCKIVQHGNVFVAASGMAKTDFNNFDAYAILAGICRQGGSIRQIANRVEAKFKGLLPGVTRFAKKNFPNLYEEEFNRRDKCALSILLAGFDGSSPVALIINFIIVESKSGSISINPTRKGCPDDCADSVYALHIGHADLMEIFLRKNPELVTSDPIKAINDAISLEIKGSPKRVGGPIDILHITSTGPCWIQRKPECRGGIKDCQKSATPPPPKSSRGKPE